MCASRAGVMAGRRRKGRVVGTTTTGCVWLQDRDRTPSSRSGCVCASCVHEVMAGRPGGRDALWTTTQQDVCMIVAGQGPQRPRYTTHTRPWGTHHMVVTLEVSVKLSGWLNAVAPLNMKLYTKRSRSGCGCASRAGGYGQKTEEGMRVVGHLSRMCTVWSQNSARTAQGTPHAHAPGVRVRTSWW